MKKFLVSKNYTNRLDFIRKIKGKKIAIYNTESDLLKEFDLCVDMNKLMKDDYYLPNLAKCDGNCTVIIIDCLIKHGVYVHPYGKIYAFTEQAKETYIIDTFAFKWDEKQIVRPFLFINPSILGASMINFYEGKENTIENYLPKLKQYLQIDVKSIKIKTIYYTPTPDEYAAYTVLKNSLINDLKNPKNKIVNDLIKFVDNTQTKIEATENCSEEGLLITSNKPKGKFDLYNILADENIKQVVFFSSKMYGSDEIELSKTKKALERHNLLIKFANGK